MLTRIASVVAQHRFQMRSPLCALVLTIGIASSVAGCIEFDARPDSWEYVHTAIIEPGCATSSCHSNLGSSAIGQSAAGLQLDGLETSYWMLTGRPCDEEPPENIPARNLVFPFQPESSMLMRQLRGIEVRRMPPDSPLPSAEIRLVENWILAGAPCR